MARFLKQSVFLSLLPAALWSAGISYSVDFEGLDDPRTLKALRSSSQLIALRKKPPSSINALRFRAESDLSDLTRVLHAQGYYEADLDFQIQEGTRDYRVIIEIRPGPQYTIERYQIHLSTSLPEGCGPICLHDIGIELGDPAESKKILDSELCVLQILSECGYPLAVIQKREILADGKTKQVKVLLEIDTGPLSYFGHTTIEGNTSVNASLIYEKILWEPRELYNSCLVEETQKELMDTGLFSSVFITHSKTPSEEHLLPLKLEVTETKHRTVSLGASYQTTFGLGATFGWEHRNVSGLGRKIHIQADIAQNIHSGVASYQIPHFRRADQTYTVVAQAAYESIKPYRMQSYSFLNRFDRQINPCFSIWVGPKIEYMLVSNSVDNGNFFLIEVPIFLRWTDVKDFLNPICGLRFEYRGTPAVNIKDISDFYFSQLFTFSHYLPLWEEDRLILAQKITLGTIFSNGIGAVPVPKRFFGGSEENLRGYKYYTVSPLDDDDKPIGGRSAIFYSLEPRFRVTESVGVVPFFDMGNVYLEQLPTFKGKWRKSVGIGLRYYSFLGPLRLDFAFPLNRREGIDPHWWVFVSLGQTF
jgi:translocation and assembly module TamA